MQNTITKNEGKKKLKWWVTTLIVLGSCAFVFLVGFICCTYIW